MLTSVEGNAVQAFCKGRMLLTELETSARNESKRMTNHNTPQLSRMGLLVHCAIFPGLSRLNTGAVDPTAEETMRDPQLPVHFLGYVAFNHFRIYV
jgi:hypothetical protein